MFKLDISINSIEPKPYKVGAKQNTFEFANDIKPFNDSDLWISTGNHNFIKILRKKLKNTESVN
jgi:hypothetical protein